ncbi:hypothetical protein [Lysinibacter cavernae]|uniref:Phage tail protein n=1 Tax=Lysinibacter cavernae TaxID=1640652 RepID=A0A7X5R130_9MICO|nr:hypothetical protein [Lysinibacter cavernae]NIH53744.1 hypothetical protein [Lysinibacter cavernae]
MQKEFLVNIKGDKGDKGDANTLRIGAVVTGETGTPASAVISGTAPDQTLSLTLPRGEKGETGAGQKWEEIENLPATFPPLTHTHTVAQVTGLDAALTGKAPAVHSHALSQVNGLDAALAEKAQSIHSHETSQVAGLDAALVALESRQKVWGGLVGGQSDTQGLFTVSHSLKVTPKWVQTALKSQSNETKNQLFRLLVWGQTSTGVTLRLYNTVDGTPVQNNWVEFYLTVGA